MAIVRQFNQINDGLINLGNQTETIAHLTVDSEQRCLKIVTFGSPDREYRGSVSQNITLTKESLQRLKEVLDRICPN